MTTNGAEHPPIVLCADDDAASRALLRLILSREGFVVQLAEDGHEVLDAVGRLDPDLLLLDIRMPGASGIEVTRELRVRHDAARLPIILVTGMSATADKVAGLEAGATDFITKPFEPTELVARARAALRTRQAFQRLESVQSVIGMIANAIEAKDAATHSHCERMADLAIGMGRRIGLDAPTIEAIGYGAVLHDIGKIGVPESVLLKPGPLDDHEWARMRRHPDVGADIVAPLRFGRIIGPIIRAHHERWDGSGYPVRLKGEEIPIGARIIALVDAFDAMTADRPYQARRSEEAAIEEILRHAGSQFDPELARLFVDGLSIRPVSTASADPLLRGLVRVT